jgi:hypothetical protein
MVYTKKELSQRSSQKEEGNQILIIFFLFSFEECPRLKVLLVVSTFPHGHSDRGYTVRDHEK